MKEDILHKQVNQYLYFYQQAHKDSILFYTYMPFGEKRTLMTGALLKAKGTKKGVPDLWFLLKIEQTKKVL